MKNSSKNQENGKTSNTHGVTVAPRAFRGLMPKIIEGLDLVTYSRALDGQFMKVWINPTDDVRDQFFLISSKINDMDHQIRENNDHLTAHMRGLQQAHLEDHKDHAKYKKMKDGPPKQAALAKIMGTYVELTQEAVMALDLDFPNDPELLGPQIDQANSDVFDWYALIWSQDEDEDTHFTGDQVRDFVMETNKSDPAFWPWLVEATQEMIKTHRGHIKKK